MTFSIDPRPDRYLAPAGPKPFQQSSTRFFSLPRVEALAAARRHGLSEADGHAQPAAEGAVAAAAHGVARRSPKRRPVPQIQRTAAADAHGRPLGRSLQRRPRNRSLRLLRELVRHVYRAEQTQPVPRLQFHARADAARQTLRGLDGYFLPLPVMSVKSFSETSDHARPTRGVTETPSAAGTRLPTSTPTA